MGRLIDVSELHNTVMLNKSEWGIFATPIDRLVESLVMQVSTVEAIPKADYKNSLKDDKVAMLTDMLIDVEEIESREQWYDYANDNCISRYDVEDLIQQKIDKLKENSDDIQK